MLWNNPDNAKSVANRVGKWFLSPVRKMVMAPKLLNALLRPHEKVG